MDAAKPWLDESHLLAAILVGFLAGTAAAGAILAATQAQSGPRHAAVLIAAAGLLLFAAVGVQDAAKARIAALGIHRAVVQALFAIAALGLQNGLTSSTHPGDRDPHYPLHRHRHRPRADARP